ncbi:MAG: MBL fold metallo-hydrolase [Bacteroidota bacterium]
MEIFKVGHSSVVVSVGNTRILTDPGGFTDLSLLPHIESLTAVIITHKHSDHISPDNIQALLDAKPDLPIYTNSETGVVLSSINAPWQSLEDDTELAIDDITVKVWEVPHHPIHDAVPAVKNLALLFNGYFFHPGDALFIPPVPVPVLAMPFGPFASIGQCMSYGAKIRPERIIPLHDGYLKEPGPYQSLPNLLWKELGITYEWLGAGESIIL